MLEFKVLQELEPNIEILETIKNYTFTTKNGKVKHLLKTNLQFIEPTEYLITYPITLTILEYKVNEISSKNFFNKFSKIFIQNPKKFLSKNREIKIFLENGGAKIYFSEQIYRGGNFMRCGIYVRVSTDDQNEFYETVSKKIPNSRRISTAGKDKM